MREESLNINVLREFVYLADSLSFKHTAEHFYVSRSVISRHMATLEETVGARLLDRDNRGVALTQAGSVFYSDAKAVLRDWETAIDRVHGVEASAGVVVRIGYLRNAARPVLVRFVQHMAEEYPDIHLSLTCMEYNELRRAMDENAVDVALAVNVNPKISRNYRSTSIYSDEFFAVCAPDHELAQQEGDLKLEDLRGQKLLLPDSYVYAGLSDLIDELVDERSLIVARAFYRDIDMLYLKVQTEGYVAFSSGMNNSMFKDRLVVLPVTDLDTSFSVSAFYHDRFIGEAYRACCEGFEWSREDLKNWNQESVFDYLD